jgi:hypothetical protein
VISENISENMVVIDESPINLVSVPKMGEIAQATAPGELLAEIAELRYPVVDHDSLINVMSPCRKYFVRGAEVDVASIAELPAWLFPLISREDLESKLQRRFKVAAPMAVSSPISNMERVALPSAQKVAS